MTAATPTAVAPTAPVEWHVVRTTGGDYSVREGRNLSSPLVSNHGRRAAVAERKADRHNRQHGVGAYAPTVGDTVRIYARELVNGHVVGRTIQPGQYVIVRPNRHGNWTVRHVPTGCTHDVFRDDVEHA